MAMDAESLRLAADARREANWKRWGPYLSERQWATVREDYSEWGTAWEYFPHEHARSRAYRWGEDGLLGITDRECRLCFALALWNGNDPILKERLFGLAGPEGNHGEDVKECYYYLDSTPTHSYMRALYKYPQVEFPYARLVEENRRRGKRDPEFELTDTGVFDGDRYFDVFVEYAKAAPDDLLIRITVANRSPEAATLHLLPTLWYRNTWVWGCKHEGCWIRPRIQAAGDWALATDHATFGRHALAAGPDPAGRAPRWLFTENETNVRRLFGADNGTPYVKDAFHEYLVHNRTDAVNPKPTGTKVAADIGGTFCKVDVTDETSVQAAFAEAGPCDIVIANAGAADSAPFGRTTLAQWNAMLAVNLTGPFLTFREGLAQMPGWGRLIAVASTAGLKGYGYVAPYAAAKHGVVGLVRSLAQEVARRPVTVNALCPGFLDTEMTDRSVATIMAKTGKTEAESRAALAASNPQKRLIRPDEVTAAALWLCGAGSDGINGQALPIAGGEL